MSGTAENEKDEPQSPPSPVTEPIRPANRVQSVDHHSESSHDDDTDHEHDNDADHDDHDNESITTIPASPPSPPRPSTSSRSPPNLAHLPSHISHTHDAPLQHYTSQVSAPDSIYDRISPSRKVIIVAYLSYCGLLAPISSTTVLAAVPEVAGEYGSTGSVINISNALYMVFMGVSPCFWGPLSQVYGRRWIALTCSTLFALCSLGTALSPNLVSFFIFRILTAFEGTAFLIVGSSCIGDIYRVTERATAMGWFLSGTLIGPAFGPFIGGIIVTFTSWRVIFYLQCGLSAFAAVAGFFLLPETIHYAKKEELKGLPLPRKVSLLAKMTNPWRVLTLYRYPNLLIACFASSAIIWNMYSLLTPIRYVLNPRFNLTSPIQGGLFYLAPGLGYITGTFFGGRHADHIVKKWIAKRHGHRVPEDRLRAALPHMGLIIPICMLLYGWSVDKEFGGIPVPVICMFVQGVAQLFCFPALNTYCLDVMHGRGAEVIAGNYVFRYVFAALGTAVVLPAVERIGVGWFSTISAVFVAGSAGAMWAAVKWGEGWRVRMEEGSRRRRRRRDGGGEEDGEGDTEESANVDRNGVGGDEEKRVGGPGADGNADEKKKKKKTRAVRETPIIEARSGEGDMV